MLAPILIGRSREWLPQVDRRRVWAETKRAASISRKFLKTCIIDGGRAVLEGRFTTRQGILIAAGQLPILLGVMLITVPALLFPTPEHNAFYEFARQLATGASSAVPILLGLVSATLGLKIPLG